MKLFYSTGIISSFVLVGLVGCSGAAEEASKNLAPLAQQVTLSMAGQPHVGAKLQGSYHYADPDGDGESGTVKVWLRDGQPIEGANLDNYEVTAKDSGKKLQFRVTPAAASGKSPGETAESSAITIENSAPTATLSEPRVGAAATLTTGVGSELNIVIAYNDVDGDEEAAADIRWLRRAATAAASDEVIPNATGRTYLVDLADLDHSVVAEVTPVAKQGVARGVPVRSQPVTIVNSVPVALSVTLTSNTDPANVGSVLSANYTYFDADQDAEDAGGSEIQWRRNNVSIPGANARTYIVTLSDVEASINFTLTPRASTGALLGDKITVGAVTVGNSAPQASSVAISGGSVNGVFVGTILSGNYAYSDPDLNSQGASEYRWLRGTNPIAGATGLSYTVKAADSGSNLVFEVTPVAAQGTLRGLPKSSAPVTVKNSAPEAKSVTLALQSGVTPPPKVNDVLIASYTYFDADGDTQGVSAIRWLSNSAPIVGAQGLSYTLLAGDSGKTISFEITPKAASGVLSGIATLSNGIVIGNSAPTATKVSIAPITAQVKTQLTASFTYADLDNDPQGASIYEWSNGGSAVIGTGSTYIVAASDAHKTLSVKVTPVSTNGGAGIAATSIGLVIANSPPSIASVAISSSDPGKAYTGLTLSAGYVFQDPDGDSEGSSIYQWFYDGTTPAPIGGATLRTYLVTGADIGKALTVQVTPKDIFAQAAGTPVTSPSITPVNLAPVASNVVLHGNAVNQVGEVLNVTYDRADLEGDAEPLTGSAIQWLRNTVAIGGATSKVYTLTTADLGKTIAAQVTPLSLTGTSPGLPKVSNSVVPNSAPVAQTVSLTASAVPAVTDTVLTANYQYFDVEGDLEGATTMRWLRNNVAIPGAQNKTYSVTSADAGQTIVYEVTPKAVSGVLLGVATLSNSTVINSVPTASAVTITPGTAQVNTPLTASFAYNDIDKDPQGASIYEWSNGTAVIGTGSTYTVKFTDAHKTLSVKVTPVASVGANPGVAVTSTGLVVDNSPPSITGVAISGSDAGKAYTGITLSLSSSYSFQDPDNDGEGASTYQWLRNGVAISGATARTYTVTGADIGTAITIQVTPKDNFVPPLAGAPVISPVAIAVVNLAPVASNVRIIDAVGSTPAKRILAASYDYADLEGDPAGSPLYVWKRNGVPVASSTIYDLGLSDAGTSISVEITPVAQSGTLVGVATAATTALNIPAANVALSVNAGLKQLHFSWAAVTSATRYRVLYNPDGVSGFVPLSAASDNLSVTAYDWDISVHRINWPNAKFMLEACDLKNTCLPSASISALSVMANAIGYFKASNTGVNDSFGWSVALSGDGNTLAVGAVWEASAATGINNVSPGQSDNTTTKAGAVYVYTRRLGIWVQEAYIKAASSRADSWFGMSIALNGAGDTLAIGTWQEGSISIYTRSAGVWLEQQHLIGKLYTDFGRSVTLSSSGDTMATGAHTDDSGAIGVTNGNSVDDCGVAAPTNCATDSGSVYVYARSAGVWTQQAYLKASNTAKSPNFTATEHFGSALAMSGDGKTLAVSSDYEGGAAIGGNEVHDCDALLPVNCAKASGAVYVFTLTTGGVWVQQAYVKASNIGAGDYFGNTIALTGDGNTLVVGARFESSAATGIDGNEAHDCAAVPPVNCSISRGAAYVFTRSAQIWTKQTYIKQSYQGQFPTSISISADGNTLVFGLTNDTKSGPSTGVILLYNRSATTWIPPSGIFASNPGANDYFGCSVSISGDGSTLAVGAYGEASAATGVNNITPGQSDNSAPFAGAVYLY
jgi:hypothetical protein